MNLIVDADAFSLLFNLILSYTKNGLVELNQEEEKIMKGLNKRKRNFLRFSHCVISEEERKLILLLDGVLGEKEEEGNIALEIIKLS